MNDTDNGSERQHTVTDAAVRKNKRKPNGYWTLERCQESALRFNTRSEWRTGDSAAYDAARRGRLGCADDCCGHMREVIKPKGYWTKARCQESALQFETRSEWCAGDGAAYSGARDRGYLDDCCGHMREVCKPHRYWTKARCQESALQFETRNAWAVGACTAYTLAQRRGWLDECCGHMREVVKPDHYWTPELCKESALRFETRNAWATGDRSAYSWAYRSGRLDECCGHMERGLRSDGDAVYIWRAVGQIAYGRRLYKPGATSERLGDRRIREVAAKHGFNPVIKALTPVRGCAFELEAKLLQLGKHPHWLEGDGRTEFRALTTAELDLALDMIAQAAS